MCVDCIWRKESRLEKKGFARWSRQRVVVPLILQGPLQKGRHGTDGNQCGPHSGLRFIGHLVAANNLMPSVWQRKRGSRVRPAQRHGRPGRRHCGPSPHYPKRIPVGRTQSSSRTGCVPAVSVVAAAAACVLWFTFDLQARGPILQIRMMLWHCSRTCLNKNNT